MPHRRITLVLAAASLAGLAGCATTSAPVSVADTIARTPQLSTLNGLVQKAGLADTLRAAGPYTVFAPTNEAFQAVPAKTMDELGKDPAQLKALLSYHVLPSRVAAADVKNGNAKTAQGGNLALARAGTFVTVEDAMVQTADIAATNGVVHTIDRVLVPPRR
ncbi:MAG TPA: fasciclin domain-containing protein [Ramlibacter sp.]|jgi:uncharacterized surface protein with fasciclin (FAS1) repeats|uniref:fasciclin domain-containing protein n=1 Tax=Ramlibacter sp. TaxID=1917967 RepID=UPI002D51C7F3|nr:fasciclin domain-containing protein [Ramlibacter sp.]HZY18223.1 fasciclin domain-containing protein [Ramlibacter sp.]